MGCGTDERRTHLRWRRIARPHPLRGVAPGRPGARAARRSAADALRPMSAVLLVTGLALLVLPGIVASLGRRLTASEWRRLNRMAIRLGFVMVALGPLLAAVPLMLEA